MPTITGTVRTGEQPLGSAYVRLIGPSGEFTAEVYTGDDGAFTFHVVDGEWRVEVRATGHETGEAAVTVAGDDAAVDITL